MISGSAPVEKTFSELYESIEPQSNWTFEKVPGNVRFAEPPPSTDRYFVPAGTLFAGGAPSPSAGGVLIWKFDPVMPAVVSNVLITVKPAVGEDAPGVNVKTIAAFAAAGVDGRTKETFEILHFAGWAAPA